jgi:AICAR transformylase/IMP cyclohydrolase PurH
MATDVATYVGKPIFGHSVVTLSRKIAAALVSRENKDDEGILEKIGIPRIDLVYVGMRPPLRDALLEVRPFSKVIEESDVGGSTLLCQAVQGYRIAMCGPDQISQVLDEIKKRDFMNGGLMLKSFICKLAQRVEQEVSLYWACSSAISGLAAKDWETVEKG